MAVQSFGHVQLANIQAINHVQRANIKSIGYVSFVTAAPDSISLDIYYLDFYADGTPMTTSSIYVTSSGSWDTTYLDDGDGIFFSCSPTSYSTSYGVTISCQWWDSPFLTRSGRIQFARDTAYVDLTIIQHDFF